MQWRQEHIRRHHRHPHRALLQRHRTKPVPKNLGATVGPCKSLPISAERAPEPAPDRPDRAQVVTAGVEPNCAVIQDYMDFMEDTGVQRVKDSVKDVVNNFQDCHRERTDINLQLRQKVKQMAEAEEKQTHVMSERSEFRVESRNREDEMARLLHRTKELNEHCQDTLGQLELELCGLVETRQMLFWKFVSQDETTMVEDCQVGDWVKKPCAKTCRAQDESPGRRVITRSVTFQPDTTTKGGQLGAKCPTLVKQVYCAGGLSPLY